MNRKAYKSWREPRKGVKLPADREILTFFGKSVPIRGMRSAIASCMLDPGYWNLLQNVRLTSGLPQVRGGTPTALGTIGAGDFRGIFQGIFNGVYTLFAAYKSGSDVIVKSSTDAVTWTEITAASGDYGATRLTDNSQLVQFAIVQDPLHKLYGGGKTDALVFNNGQGYPRVYGYSIHSGGAYKTVIHEPITVDPLTAIREHAVNLAVADFVTVNDPAATTYTNPATGDIDFADTGTTPDNTVGLTIATTVDSGDLSLLTFASDQLTCTGRTQLLLGVDTEYTALWDNLKVELYDGTNYLLVWDPSEASPTRSAPVIVPLGAGLNKDICVFDIGFNAGVTWTAERLRLTWVGTAGPAAAVFAEIFLIACSGSMYGGASPIGTQYAISFYNQGSKSESPAIVFPKYQTPSLKSIGGTALSGARLPLDERLSLRGDVPVPNPTNADVAKGVDYALFYRKQPDDDKFYYVGKRQLSTVIATVWTLDVSANLPVYVQASVLTTDHAPEVLMPEGQHIPIPQGRALKFANNRLFVGATASGTGDANLYFSHYKHGFRFRPAIKVENGQVDDDSGGSHTISGESVCAFAEISTSTIGVNSIYAFTAEGVYALGGRTSRELADIGRVSIYGTLSPASVQVMQGSLLWLDNEMQVRRFSGGLPDNLSAELVEDYTTAIPGVRKEFLCSAVYSERYYLGFSPSGATTNTRILVWDQRQQGWVLDVPPKASEGLLRWFDGTNKVHKLLMVGIDGSDLKAYHYDSTAASQDLGSDIAIAFNPYEYHLNWERKLAFRRIGIVCDDSASGALAFTRTYKPHGGTMASTMSIDVSTNQAWRWSTGFTLTGEGNGASCQLTITGTAKANTKFYSLVAEVQLRGLGRDVG